MNVLTVFSANTSKSGPKKLFSLFFHDQQQKCYCFAKIFTIGKLEKPSITCPTRILKKQSGSVTVRKWVSYRSKWVSYRKKVGQLPFKVGQLP